MPYNKDNTTIIKVDIQQDIPDSVIFDLINKYPLYWNLKLTLEYNNEYYYIDVDTKETTATVTVTEGKEVMQLCT